MSINFDVITEKWCNSVPLNLAHSNIGKQTYPMIKWDETLQLLYAMSVDGLEFYDFRMQKWQIVLSQNDIWHKICDGNTNQRMNLKNVIVASNQ